MLLLPFGSLLNHFGSFSTLLGDRIWIDLVWTARLGAVWLHFGSLLDHFGCFSTLLGDKIWIDLVWKSSQTVGWSSQTVA